MVSGWKNVLLENAITPIQQYSYSTGKNASDSALIIDAMDILYTGKIEIDREIIKPFTDSITDLENENGWAFLGELGTLMLKKKPNFDPRNYGFAKMLPLIKSMNKFEIDERDSGKNHIKHIYVRKK